MEKSIGQLKFIRRGKKSAITKRIATLEKLVAEGGGRRVIASLMERLQAVVEETEKICEEIANRSEEIDLYNDLENVRIDVDTCLAYASDYLNERVNDPPLQLAVSPLLGWKSTS